MKGSHGQPRVLFYDLETAPSLGFSWGKYEQNIIAFKQDWYILSFAYKFQGEKNVTVKALPDYRGYKPNAHDDRRLVEDLWKVLDEADILVGHNIENFDNKKAFARFIKHGLTPPSPFKSVDTLKIARKHFQFEQGNRLNDLAKFFSIGSKLPHTGADLWFGCMRGDKASWRVMKQYNAHDVELTEKVYEKLRPWATTHPDMTLFDHIKACPVCRSVRTQKRGLHHTKTMTRQRHRCLNCGFWFLGDKIKV